MSKPRHAAPPLFPSLRRLAVAAVLGGAVLPAVAEQAGAEGRAMGDTTEHQGETARLTNFTDPQHNQRWRVVNDDVMGGRSIGGVEFDPEAGRLIFAGSINTNGGGFSSIRLPLDRGTLEDATHVRLRYRADSRGPYRLQVMDDLPSRDRRINHRYALPTDNDTAGQWQTQDVPLDGMTPSWRGDPVDVEPLDPSRAVELGVILNDTGDGPFRLEIDRIDVVH